MVAHAVYVATTSASLADSCSWRGTTHDIVLFPCAVDPAAVGTTPGLVVSDAAAHNLASLDDSRARLIGYD